MRLNAEYRILYTHSEAMKLKKSEKYIFFIQESPFVVFDGGSALVIHGQHSFNSYSKPAASPGRQASFAASS
jgi:hypothetical protein